MTGTIFNIQRFCVNDGPGIRTTVFLKGCPLKCKWCHNPESILPYKELMFHEDRCIRCGDCFAICEQKAVERKDEKFIHLREKCIQCGKCIEVCVSEARAIAGREVSTDEVMNEIIKDIVFYDQSGGGVTFSGGEPLLQHEFLLSLLKACKEKNIYTAVDTSGYISTEILQSASRFVDLFLYDLKTLNSLKHLEFTSVSNELILENLKNLLLWQKKVIVRIPIISNINDGIQEISRIGEFIEYLKSIDEIHLLPYHKTGIEKYHRLGIDYSMDNLHPPSRENINLFVNELEKHVKRVVIGG